jgi:hypothetical protein
MFLSIARRICMDFKYGLGDRVQMKKEHPCGYATWQVIRIGADIKIKCEGCGRIVMLDRSTFDKRLKKVVDRKTEGKAVGRGDSAREDLPEA